MKVLITGGTGFIGSNLISSFKKENEIIVTGCKTEQMAEDYLILENSFIGLNFDRLKELDLVLHQAANNDSQSKDFQEMELANVKAPIKLFNFCYDKCRCINFVYASSCAIYGYKKGYREGEVFIESQKWEPLSYYGKSKQNFEREAIKFQEETGSKVIGLRYSNVYGPGESHKGSRASMVYQIAKQMLQGKRPKLFKYGEQKRDWVYIKDVIKANEMAVNSNKSGIYNVGSGEAHSFNEIVQIINDELGTKLEPEYVDNPYIETYQNYTKCSLSKINKELGYEPKYNLKQGIKEYLWTLKN